MLRLFHSIFGGDDGPERYPDALVQAATERAVDGTDPWLRGLTAYRRKLRPAVVHAIDHVVKLVDDSLAAPLELSREGYGDSPLLRLFFISTEQMNSILQRDPALAAFRQELGHEQSPAWALLTMECELRRTFGAELTGETIVRDVAQITVSMASHRLLDPCADPNENRRLLKRRAFDQLLSLALARIAAIEDVREDLLRRRTLLQSKHAMLESSDWGFSDPGREAPPALDEVHRQLDDIEAQLLEFGGDDHYLEKNLEIVNDVLGNAERHFWTQPLTLIVDRMGIRRNAPADDAPELTLTELHNAAGQRRIAQLVMIPPATTTH